VLLFGWGNTISLRSQIEFLLGIIIFNNIYWDNRFPRPSASTSTCWCVNWRGFLAGLSGWSGSACSSRVSSSGRVPSSSGGRSKIWRLSWYWVSSWSPCHGWHDIFWATECTNDVFVQPYKQKCCQNNTLLVHGLHLHLQCLRYGRGR
jgi:hypothetical protein